MKRISGKGLENMEISILCRTYFQANMYKLFVDDSGHKDYLNPYSRDTKESLPEWNDDNREFLDNNFFILCGIHISTTDIQAIDNEIKNLKIATF